MAFFFVSHPRFHLLQSFDSVAFWYSICQSKGPQLESTAAAAANDNIGVGVDFQFDQSKVAADGPPVAAVFVGPTNVGSSRLQISGTGGTILRIWTGKTSHDGRLRLSDFKVGLYAI